MTEVQSILVWIQSEGCTDSELAAHLGVSRETIYRSRGGKGRYSGSSILPALRKIAKQLGMPEYSTPSLARVQPPPARVQPSPPRAHPPARVQPPRQQSKSSYQAPQPDARTSTPPQIEPKLPTRTIGSTFRCKCGYRNTASLVGVCRGCGNYPYITSR